MLVAKGAEMSQQLIECKNCGEVCGSYYPAQTYGDPDDCCPAEYDVEPEVVDDNGNEFCSQSCLDEFWEIEKEVEIEKEAENE